MKQDLVTFYNPKAPISEMFRTLRTNIQFMSGRKKTKTLLVTSTFPEEGKSWVSSNLAVTFAQTGKNVILIDADMRKGVQYKIFNVAPNPGLSNYLSNIDSAESAFQNYETVNYIQETEIPNLQVISAGNVPPNPAELLISDKIEQLLEQLEIMCDIVIIDGSPCALVTDSTILSRIVDTTLVVASHGQTRKDGLHNTVKSIQNVGGNICGIIYNKAPISSKKYSETYYYGSTKTRK